VTLPTRDPEPAARASLRRSAIVYGLLLAADVVVGVFVVAGGLSGGAYVALSIAGLIGLLIGYHVLQHVRDLGADVTESEGAVSRKWTRADLIVAMQSYYIMVDRVVYRLRPEDYIHLEEGMRVKIVYFPHSLNVVSAHEVPGGLRSSAD
jgi:xanthosine utilization system XapX-like protein